MILALPESKGASRSGQPETVVCNDPALVAQLKARWITEGSYGSFTREYTNIGRFLGIRNDALTPHDLRSKWCHLAL